MLRLNWKWIVFIFIVVLFLFSNQSFRTYWQKKRYLAKLERNLKEIRLENKKLKMEIHRIETDPRIIEQHARRELGLIKPGEIEYRFIVNRSTEQKREK